MIEHRDYHYARHSAVMSNERTLLSYIRTSLTFFIAGITFLQIFKDQYVIATGFIFLIIGLILMSIGFIRFFQVKFHIEKIKHP